MEDAIDDLLRCPQNNLRIYKNAQLIYDETISRQQQSLCDIFPRYFCAINSNSNQGPT